MNPKNLTKAQLLAELNDLQRRFSKVKNENRTLTDAVLDRSRLERSLRERIKELACLYGVAKVIEESGGSIEKMLQGIADLLPGSWQYPEITRARIVFENKAYVSDAFTDSKWKQTAELKVGGEKNGTIEVYYLKKMAELDEGPFLREERLLINAVAERTGRAIERLRAEEQLQTERTALNNMNIALREVLARVEEEKKEISTAIQANTNKVILPILLALDNSASSEQKPYIALLRNNLEEITSPFTNKLSKTFMSLTPVEIQTCNMVKNGFSTKEIAGLRHISPATVNRHREHIRRKLGITNKDINLATYLQTHMSENRPQTVRDESAHDLNRMPRWGKDLHPKVRASLSSATGEP